jgi:hypothetical protein
MTFQEAQTKFSAIVGSLTATMTSGEVLQKQRELIALQNSLPESAEFDVIANTIADYTPKLTGITTQDVLDSLKSREDSIMAASSLLTQVANKASANAKTLTFTEPKLIAAALNETVTRLQELRNAAKVGDFEQVATKVDALSTLIENVRSSIKAS